MRDMHDSQSQQRLFDCRQCDSCCWLSHMPGAWHDMKQHDAVGRASAQRPQPCLLTHLLHACTTRSAPARFPPAAWADPSHWGSPPPGRTSFAGRPEAVYTGLQSSTATGMWDCGRYALTGYVRRVPDLGNLIATRMWTAAHLARHQHMSCATHRVSDLKRAPACL